MLSLICGSVLSTVVGDAASTVLGIRACHIMILAFAKRPASGRRLSTVATGVRGLVYIKKI